MALRLSAFCLCSHRIQRRLVYTEKRSGKNEMDCTGKQVPVDAAAQFHARTGKREGLVREMILHSIR